MKPANDSNDPKKIIEEGDQFLPSFDAQGLIPTIVECADDGETLMVAWMNQEALNHTITTGEAHFWSRSRRSLWKKGETSGQTLKVLDILVDCDQDCLLLKVKVGGDGGCCHTGRRKCFYRSVVTDQSSTRLQFLS